MTIVCSSKARITFIDSYPINLVPQLTIQDVYRFVVVYRLERASFPGELDQWRGRVLPVLDPDPAPIDELSTGFTDLDQLPNIIRQKIADRIENKPLD